jgi:hypothetical protein
MIEIGTNSVVVTLELSPRACITGIEHFMLNLAEDSLKSI